ncbi:hypothetical protein [Azoarcus sp. L1K30]|nr:hypothetical protein [Azoarcus sp. L1K30]
MRALIDGVSRYPLCALISAMLWGVVELVALQRARFRHGPPDR